MNLHRITLFTFDHITWKWQNCNRLSQFCHFSKITYQDDRLRLRKLLSIDNKKLILFSFRWHKLSNTFRLILLASYVFK